MTSRVLSLSFFALMLSSVVVVAGCSGVDTGEQAATAPEEGDDDDDDDDGAGPTPSGNPTPNPTATPTTPGAGNEVEVNDDHDTATPITSTFSGKCGGMDLFDIFKIAVPAGKTLSATLTYSDSAQDDLDLYVSNYDYTIDKGDETVAPGDSPAQAAALFPTAQSGYVEVFCYWAVNPVVSYTGTVSIQ